MYIFARNINRNAIHNKTEIMYNKTEREKNIYIVQTYRYLFSLILFVSHSLFLSFFSFPSVFLIKRKIFDFLNMFLYLLFTTN